MKELQLLAIDAAILLALKTTLAVAATLAVLVVAHEWGHFMAAKLVGVRVKEFAFGFGPRLLKLFQRGDTEYTIHPVPLGGFVRLAGMEPGEDEDEPDGYNAQPIWKRFVIIFSGPLMSFVLAYVLFCTLGMTIGLPEGDVLNEVEAVQKGSPAEKAGLQAHDRVIAIDGRTIATGADLREVVHRNAGRELTLRVQRGNRRFAVEATPRLETVEGRKVGLLGVHLSLTIRKANYGVKGSVVRGTQLTVGFIKQLFKSLTTSKGLKDVGGIVAITRITAEGVKEGLYQVIFQLAALSLTLAVINLVPWPILDGGHILLLGLESVRRRKLTPQQTVVFQMIGLASLVALAVFLFYLDIVRWVPIDKPLR